MLASSKHYIKPGVVGVRIRLFMRQVISTFKPGGPLYFQAEGEGKQRNVGNYFITQLLTTEILK